ncbi:MAG: hypothetical protein QXL17_00040 [Candidatus Thermoplasmatota archaeon]
MMLVNNDGEVAMAREFTKNMFIMLVSIMIGAIIITYFVADIVNRSTIDTIRIEHATEITTITSTNENFTDFFLQGSIKMDAAREAREVGNYYFDFALYWYSTALVTLNSSSRNETIDNCIENCSNALQNYWNSYTRFGESRPRFVKAQNYTSKAKYLEVLGYYVQFADAGKNITYLRYNASNYLRQIAENLSIGATANVSMLLVLFNETLVLYQEQVQMYNNLKQQINEYTFFETDRTKPGT